MKIPQMIAAEFRRLTASPMAILALVALMCVPLLYGGLYLWANQNPYDKLDKIPAALVVSDTGAKVDGKTTNYGEKIAASIVEDGSFDWHEVSATEAAAGVHDSRYDFSLTLPADFSDALASASGTHPRQAKVTITTNDANSYLSSTIGQQAAQTIRTTVAQQVNKQAATQFLVGLSTVRGNLVTATSGSQQLLDGLGSAQSGASQLADGTSQLASGNSQLASGLGTLSSGLDQLQNATSSLPSQTQQLAAGAQQVAAGDQQLADKASQANTVVQNAISQLPAVQQQVTQKLLEQGLSPAQIADLLSPLSGVQSQVAAGSAQLQRAVSQTQQLAAGANQVAAGAQQLADASPALSQGIANAASGASQLKTGADQAATGASQAASGAASLNSGLGTLKTGLASLHDGLAKGVTQIPDSSTALRDKQATTISNPVNLKEASTASAGSYGGGLAPFFIALAAWIGIYALFLIVKPVSRRAITALRSPIRVTLAGWLTPGLLGAVQMIMLFGIVALALRFPIHDPLPMFGFMALASLAFASIIMTLNVLLGSVGQFLGLVLMVVQLVSAGGTFPWQTLPGPLAALHQVLPLSYAVDGIRQLMYGGNMAAAWSDAGALALWTLIPLLLSAIAVNRMTRFRTLRDLRPSLIG